MSKNLGYYTYTGSTEVTAGNTLPLTNTVRQRGNCIRLRNNAVVLRSMCACNGGEQAVGADDDENHGDEIYCNRAHRVLGFYC